MMYFTPTAASSYAPGAAKSRTTIQLNCSREGLSALMESVPSTLSFLPSERMAQRTVYPALSSLTRTREPTYPEAPVRRTMSFGITSLVVSFGASILASTNLILGEMEAK